MDDRTPTAQDAGEVALDQFDAPADIHAYLWIRAEADNGGPRPVRPPRSGATVRLVHAFTTTHGVLWIGWDAEQRLAAYAWQPTAHPER